MYFRSQKKTAGDVSLSDSIETGRDGSPLSLMEILCSDEDLCEDFQTRELEDSLHKAMLRCLNEREQQILALRYGFGSRDPLPQREVALRCGISRSYVSRLEKKAIQKLRRELLQETADPP